MTREEHFNAYLTFHKLAMDALHGYAEDTTKEDLWNAYRKLMKTANKHYGISRAMQTKKMKKYMG